MSTYNAVSSSFHAPSNGWQAFADEVVELFKALLSPNKIIGEVERMRALQVEADRIQATEPARAAALRRLAARSCVR